MTVSLKNLNASAYQYQLTVQEEFKLICEPLFKLGVKSFLYVQAFPDGRYLMFHNDIIYTKAFLEKVNWLGEGFTNHIKITKRDESYYTYIPFNFDLFNNKKEPVLQLVCDFNFGDVFFINKAGASNSLKCYAFTREHTDICSSDFYLNNLRLLERFCTYFDEKAERLVCCIDQRKLAYMEQQFVFYQSSEEERLTQKIEEFLRETFIKKRILRTKEKDILLTNREVECLTYLSLGMTDKEIARTLELSHRTIQFYFQNIRQKSGLKRGELLASFIREGGLNGILPRTA